MEVMMAESLRVFLLMLGRGCMMTLPCALGCAIWISSRLIQMEAVKGNVEPGRLREAGRYMNYEAKAACTIYPFKGCRYPTYSAESHQESHNLYDAQ